MQVFALRSYYCEYEFLYTHSIKMTGSKFVMLCRCSDAHELWDVDQEVGGPEGTITSFQSFLL